MLFQKGDQSLGLHSHIPATYRTSKCISTSPPLGRGWGSRSPNSHFVSLQNRESELQTDISDCRNPPNSIFIGVGVSSPIGCLCFSKTCWDPAGGWCPFWAIQKGGRLLRKYFAFVPWRPGISAGTNDQWSANDTNKLPRNIPDVEEAGKS